MTRRWLDRCVSAVEVAGARVYARRHPGPLGRAVITALSPLVRRTTPNDKWSLHTFVEHWMRALAVPPRHPRPDPKRIFLFCAYRIEFTLNLNLAILLAWRGHRVTLGYLPKLQSPIKEPRQDHRSARPYLAAALRSVERWSGGRIRCVELTDSGLAPRPLDEAFIARQVPADLMMMTRSEALDMADPETRRNVDYYTDLGRRAQRIASAHFHAHRDDYDLALIPNGTTFESAQVCHVAKSVGLPITTFEKFAFRYIRVTDHGDHCMAFDDLDVYWSLRHDAGYEAEPFYARACARGLQLLEEHRAGATRNWAMKLQTAPPGSADEIRAAIGLRPGQPFVLVCPNVPFDAGYMQLTTIFPSMRAWLLSTVSFLLERTDATVVMRAHPAEALHWGTTERSPTILADAGLRSPRLVTVPAEAAVNTYALIDASQSGVVFSSTVGLEMAMLGKPVLAGSDIYYTGRGFTIDVKDRAQYLEELGRLAADPLAPTAEQVRQARLFYYMVHFVWQRPYPYDKPSDIRRLPPAALLSGSLSPGHLDTIDALAMTPAQWRDHVSRTLRAAGDEQLRTSP
jgi:hypothetical protein